MQRQAFITVKDEELGTEEKETKLEATPEAELEDIYHVADASAARCLLKNLNDKLDISSPIYAAALAVHTEGTKLLDDTENNISAVDERKLKRSVAVVLNLFDTLKCCTEHERKRHPQSPRLDSEKIIEKYPVYKRAISLLEKNAKDDAIGKAQFWTKFKGALLMLVGAAVTALAFIGLPITLGGSIGLSAAGGFLFAGGSTLFANGRQKSIAKETSTLANQAKKLIY